MPVKCECGEEYDGDVCMVCGKERAGQPASVAPAQEDAPEPTFIQPPTQAPDTEPVPTPVERAALADDTPRGSLGGYQLDISRSIMILDGGGDVIYDIPHGDAKCSIRLGSLRIARNGSKAISMRGSDAKAWRRAISHQQAPPIWFLHGAEDCEVMYGDRLLGVTPCVVTAPFSWAAFRSGSYELTIRRPGMGPQRKTVPAASGTHQIRFPDGQPAERSGGKPEGELLVLNGSRSLVMSEPPCLVDHRGAVVLRMPGAAAKIAFLKRGATITWLEPTLGKLSVAIKCDSKLKYDRLAEMLPPVPEGQPAEPPGYQPSINPQLADAAGSTSPEVIQLHQPKQAEPPAKKKPWWRFGKPKGNKWNRGTFEGVDLAVTQNDLDTKVGRLDGYAFEAVMANLLAAMNYKIEKGYDVKSGRMLGPTKSDMGVDVLAVKGDNRVVCQCKHWKDQCGGPDVNKTIGAASTNGGTSVLMICTGGFSQQAIDIAKQSSMPVELWDWETLRKNIRRYLLK